MRSRPRSPSPSTSTAASRRQGAPARASAYLAADPAPPAASVEVVKRLLGNLLREPENDKFRRVRLSNPRIKEAVADREGGMELLEAVGFRVRVEGGEPFAVMNEVPRDARLNGIRRAILLVEGAHPSAPPVKAEVEAKERCSNVADLQDGAKNIDRQVTTGFS
jgi:UBX domain-containing protein 6